MDLPSGGTEICDAGSRRLAVSASGMLELVVKGRCASVVANACDEASPCSA
jgi:hypothetical protein